MSWLRSTAEKPHSRTWRSRTWRFPASFCNTYKGPNLAGIDPTTGNLTRLFHPRTDRWAEHFRWTGSVLEGLTAVGRTTIEVLRMNHPDALAVRQSLIEEGLV